MFSQANWGKSGFFEQGVEHVSFQSQVRMEMTRANSENSGVVLARSRTYDLLIISSHEDDSGELGKYWSGASESNVAISHFGRSTTELKQSWDS